MARVTLIRPPAMELAGNLSYFRAAPPIGLAYVAASLRKAGHSLQIIDAVGLAPDRYVRRETSVGVVLQNGLPIEEIAARVDPGARVVGISHMFLHEWPAIRELCALIRARLPGVAIVLGGENATAFWETIFVQAPAVDYCVMGEGEVTILRLVEAIEAGAGDSDLPGVTSRRTRKADAARPASALTSERLSEPDEIPWPAWDLFPLDSYLRVGGGWGVDRGRSMPILATRGCPFSCTFCSSPAMWTTKYKLRAVADVVAEMVFYVDTYGVNNFDFCDLTAIISREWILELCERLRLTGRPVEWQFPTGTRTEALDRTVLAAIRSAGCRNITYAPESGSPRMLEMIKKKVKLPRMLDSLRSARDAGLVTRVNIILGFPDEKRSDIAQSLAFLVQCALAGVDDAAVMTFAPYPGSEETRRLIADHRLVVDETYYYQALARSGLASRTYNRGMSTPELVSYQFAMLLAFYGLASLSHPRRALRMAERLLSGSEETQIEQAIHAWLRKRRKLGFMEEAAV